MWLDVLTSVEGPDRLRVFSGGERFEHFFTPPSAPPAIEWMAILLATSVGLGGLAIVVKLLL